MMVVYKNKYGHTAMYQVHRAEEILDGVHVESIREQLL